MDQFVNEKKYYEYLNDKNEVVKNITFLTKAEDKCLSVAVASIISRFIFLKEFKDLEKELGLEIPKGAGTLVDEAAIKIVKLKGLKNLDNIAKLNFKNLDKIKKGI
jgi:ribonuclease HIII